MRMKDATEIPINVRQRVYDRDSWDGAPCCIICGKPYPQVHHYVERSRGGLGIEENLVCLCASCHGKADGPQRTLIANHIRQYLMNKYPNWDESKLVKEKTYGPYKDWNDNQE